MLGAIIGDIVGSTRERHNIKTEDFELVPSGSRFTDDTVMTLAVAEWLMTDPRHTPKTLVACMQRLGRKYPNAGYGKMFSQWLMSDNPQPYYSFGNGSAMRVSPVGLYADSLEEALELARITASVTHNHPEGIKGAQAIAGCVFLKKNANWGAEEEIRHFITEKIGYKLDFNLDDIRDAYGFDVTCQGSVPIAIKAYLERSGYSAEKALRLAISMGGDSDTIGAMTASIASAKQFCTIGGGFSDDLVNQCRALLPDDLLGINDRFEAFVSRPLHQSYYIGRYLFAGEYPGDKYGELAEAKLKRMHHFGVRHFVDLTEEGELRPYHKLLPGDTTYLRFPIRDVDVPKSVEDVHQLIDKMEYLMQQDGYTYIHCWGGVGRTGTIVACYEARQIEEPTLEKALTAMRNNFSKMPKASHRKSPETQEQIDFVRRFVDSCKQRKEYLKLRTKDRIRGSLMAGAAGDALGYAVEFMSRNGILAQYGNNGITKFDLTAEGKALVSDDTQMTLFTACGMLMGVTRGYIRGIGGQPEKYVDGAYLDWYYTQTGKKKKMLTNDFHYTWLRDLPELAHRRAPGNTCLSACECLYQGIKVQNNSKGCGGIMRVAPMALLMAGYWSRGESFYDVQQMDEAGAEVAAVTHKHPLAFLSSAMLTHLIYRVIRMEDTEVKANIADIALETIPALDNIYKGEYEDDKLFLANLTRKAVMLAANNKSDAENIRLLGEGWTGEEAWAIALYCAVRHIDSIADAIIAAVNHDGDSDSTGAVCGNIMGAIYGYEAMKHMRLFCPQGKELEQTLELSDIILTLADDLYTSCIISECAPIDTPEKRQWYERYCEMKPVGLKN
ncbi:MAG: ADP-ribosylglycohydrolase family protein [Muribaculaceae bacterium]